MIFKMGKNQDSFRSGFTIVELLIVIVVIAILAAITIVAYNGIQNRAYDTTVQADMSAVAKKMELYRVNATDGLYPANNQMTNVGLVATQSAYDVSRNNWYYCRSPDGTRYSIGFVSRSGQGYFVIDGKVSKSSGVWLASTCSNVGQVDTMGLSGFESTTNPKVWAAWTKA